MLKLMYFDYFTLLDYRYFERFAKSDIFTLQREIVSKERKGRKEKGKKCELDRLDIYYCFLQKEHLLPCLTRA